MSNRFIIFSKFRIVSSECIPLTGNIINIWILIWNLRFIFKTIKLVILIFIIIILH